YHILHNTPAANIYTLSLHDALPIFTDQRWCCVLFWVAHAARVLAIADFPKDCFGETPKPARETRALPNRLSRGFNQRCNCAFLRSEEHTSELQSLAYLVCRLLLEKK